MDPMETCLLIKVYMIPENSPVYSMNILVKIDQNIHELIFYKKFES